ELIYEKEGKIYRTSSWFYLKKDWKKTYTNPRRASGLTRYQIVALRKLVKEGKIKDELRIKKGMPFAPALAAGVFVTVFFGDIYWQFIIGLFGYI
ncbi:MAG: A24 family peptidase C-terminal domain-containing protein, partial [Candidatus Margulisiibacteriota bacterium]